MQMYQSPARIAAKVALSLILLVSLNFQFCLTGECQNQPATSTQSSADPTTTEAMKLILDGKIPDAKALLLKAVKDRPHIGVADPNVPYFLAALEFQDSEFDAARKHLEDARALYDVSTPGDALKQLLIQKRLGDCSTKLDDIKTAEGNYKTALMICQTISNAPEVVREEILESLVGSSLRQKNYNEAENYTLNWLKSAQARLQTTPQAVFNVLWAHLQLADIYRVTGQENKLAAVRTQLRPLMLSLVERRMAATADGSLPSDDALVAHFRQNYVNEVQPRSSGDVVWAAAEFKVRSLPIIGWQSSAGPAKAVVICIHGLGLENRAFERTATKLNARGYTVYGLDVRGFGSWTQTQGLDNIDYDQAIADIGTIASTIKSQSPGMKVFVLGESMGGAIALRAGAKLAGQIDGVISSVPSAERFQAKKMSLQTAVHFIKDPHKAFDVGYVAAMATSKQDAQNMWKADPKAKLRLTPLELTEFALFMRRTMHEAKEITALPVLVVQGLKDRLVKPSGTFDLFDAVTSEDKTLYLAGPAEHLMFENSAPDPILIDVVDSWLKNHSDNSAP